MPILHLHTHKASHPGGIHGRSIDGSSRYERRTRPSIADAVLHPFGPRPSVYIGFGIALIFPIGAPLSDAHSPCDGQQAWDMLVRTGADMVVSDRMMPGLEGPELCRRVRAQQDGSYTYFILLTTLADRRSALEGMEAGADDYLPKPLDVGELQLRLIAAQRITQLHKELLERDTHLRYLAGTDPLTELPNRTLRRVDGALHCAASV